MTGILRKGGRGETNRTPRRLPRWPMIPTSRHRCGPSIQARDRGAHMRPRSRRAPLDMGRCTRYGPVHEIWADSRPHPLYRYTPSLSLPVHTQHTTDHPSNVPLPQFRMQFQNTSDTASRTNTNRHDARSELHAKLLDSNQLYRVPPKRMHPCGLQPWLQAPWFPQSTRNDP